MKKIMLNLLALMLALLLFSCGTPSVDNPSNTEKGKTDATQVTTSAVIKVEPADLVNYAFEYRTYNNLRNDLLKLKKGETTRLSTNAEIYGDTYNKTIDWFASGKLPMLVPMIGSNELSIRDFQKNNVFVYTYEDFELPWISYVGKFNGNDITVELSYISVLEDERIESAQTYVDLLKIIDPDHPNPNNYSEHGIYEKIYEKEISIADKPVTAMFSELKDSTLRCISYYADGVIVNLYADEKVLTNAFFTEFQMLDYDKYKNGTLYTVLETLGQNTIQRNPLLAHSEDVIGTKYFPFEPEKLSSFEKDPAPENIKVEIDEGVFEEVSYYGSENNYYLNSEIDKYKKEADGLLLEIHKESSTGKICYFFCDSAKIDEKYQNADPVYLKGGIDIVKAHFKEYVGSEEVVDSFRFTWNREEEGSDKYHISATRRYNGILTCETVEYTVTNRGYIESYFIDVDTTMDVKKAPNKLQNQLIWRCIDEKLSAVYSELSGFSVTFGWNDPVLVRLCDGSYALEYKAENCEIGITETSERFLDPLHLFVILE